MVDIAGLKDYRNLSMADKTLTLTFRDLQDSQPLLGRPRYDMANDW